MSRTTITRFVAVIAVMAACAAVFGVAQGRATLGSSYQGSWSYGYCVGNKISSIRPYSIKPTAPIEWVKWRTHIWRLNASGGWDYQTASPWKVTKAYGGGVDVPGGGGDEWTIYKSGRYAVVGEIYYYNVGDSAFSNITLTVQNDWWPFESYKLASCVF
jgi:hypothetical protein